MPAGKGTAHPGAANMRAYGPWAEREKVTGEVPIKSAHSIAQQNRVVKRRKPLVHAIFFAVNGYTITSRYRRAANRGRDGSVVGLRNWMSLHIS